MFRLAAHLGMTVGELSLRMDSREFTEWKAFNRYFEPFGDGWRQTALLIVAILAPYSRRGQFPKPESFMPVAPLPQTPEEAAEEIRRMIEGIGGKVDEPEPPESTPEPESDGWRDLPGE